MKKLSLFVILIIVSASFTTFFAQSRPPVTGTGKKANQRPSPTPPNNSENATTNQTNSDKVTAVEDNEVLRIETNLVTIPVKVLDRGGKFIAGLKKDDFKVFEDDSEQEIAYFSNIEEPFTVVLMLDMSYSTIFKTSEIQSAAIGFTAQLRPNDKVMVVSFDQEPQLLCEPTTDRQESSRAIKSTKIGTGTSLYEAVDFVIHKKLSKIEGRKAIVLFTDGVDTTSRSADFGKNVRDAEELDAIIYPIQYDTYSDVQNASRMPAPFPIPTGSPSTVPSSTRLPTSTGNSLPFPFPQTTNRRTRTDPNDPTSSRRNPTDPTDPSNPRPSQNPSIIGAGTTEREYETADLYLKTMAGETGGRVLLATDKASMALAFSNIADELRQTYSLGFYPKEEKLEKKRRLKVRVAQKGAVVRSRESYTVSKKAKKFAVK
jgi:Ca-activated chloride channel family protein